MSDTTERARIIQRAINEATITLAQKRHACACLAALAAELAAAEKRNTELEAAMTKITSAVDAQAEDEALWALYPMGEQPISEAYLQQELRHLHTVIEAAVSEGKP